MRGDERPVGVFDSGVGGLSVLDALRRLVPAEDLVYYADQAHFPYGVRSAADVCALAVAAVERLLAEDAKLVVVACNTASSAALPALRARFTTPIVGIEPAVKPACALTRTGRVGVLATSGTVQGEALRALIERVAGDVEVITSPAGDLVELIEAGEAGSAEAERVVRAALAPLQTAGVDVVALGCTHFAFVRSLVERILGPEVTVLEPAEAVARQAARVLRERGLTANPDRNGAVRYRSSAGEERLAAARACLAVAS
jgi:glutamate racemase